MRVIEDLSGQLIGGRYRARELIGVGGMDSAVWKAWQIGAERAVAIKVLPPADDAAGKRFARGARIAANLSHPNCLVIHDYGKTEDGKLYLAMELLVGNVLQDVLPAEGMGVPDVLHIVDQVLQALEHAHAQRAVHRDLKPDNLFLCRKNDDALHVKILDFGIAKYIEEDPNGPDAEGGKDDFEDLVTEQRQVCGTPQYMAPEQVVGARVDGRADLYALGCVMYRMLTGRLPFDGKTRYELYQKHLQEAPRPFSEMRPDLEFPARLELIVMKSLAKRPDQRFQSAAEMRHALQTVQTESRTRRAARARVSQKHTSPQQASAAPWTLSQPSPLYNEGQNDSQHGSDDGTDPTIAPSAVYGSMSQTVPPLPVAPHTTPPPTPPVMVSMRASQTASQNARSAPVPAPPTRQPTLRPGQTVPEQGPQALLNDAVLRHPASRNSTQERAAERASSAGTNQSRMSAMTPMVPRSTETEPSSVADRDEPPRRNWATFAVMGGAFLLGVGGVALAMSLSQGGADAIEEVAHGAPTQVEAGTTNPAKPVVEARGAVGGVVDTKPPVGTPNAVTAEVENAAGAHAGVVAGRALADVPIEVADAPALVGPVQVAFESDPAGATIKEAGKPLGTTPGKIALAVGKHSLTVERAGFKPMPLELDVTAADATALPRKVVMVAEKAPGQPGRANPINGNGAVAKDPIHEPAKDTGKGPGADDVKTVDLLSKKVISDPKANDTGAKANPDAAKKPVDPAKKPIVKLLDDDDPPAPKPKVKVLDDP